MLEKQGSAELKSGRRWATDLVLSFLDTNAKREIESSSLRHWAAIGSEVESVDGSREKEDGELFTLL